ncbi:MAG: hypothetical protein LH649_05235 [Pseudanabaena sp. CAN_BIN31]|nr:hypothetical protein [Pseudanabaena sp. CAN_BIN31]
MDINQLGTSNLTGSGFITPDVLATDNTLFISQPNTQNPTTTASLSSSQSTLLGSSNFEIVSLNSSESIVYLNNFGISRTNSIASTSTIPLIDQNSFSVGSLPKTLMFKGSSASDDLYLKLDASSILNFSTDGTNYFSLNFADLSDKLDISVDLGDGNDSLHIDSSVFKALQNVDSKIRFDGGLGSNSLYGPAIDSTWNVTGSNSGDLGKIEFQNVGDLKGAADNKDEFVFSPLGNLSGVADGGSGGFDTLVINGGTYTSSLYTAFSPNDGTIALDDKLITYAGLEPIIDNTIVADRVFNATIGNDNIVVQDDGVGRTIIFSSDSTPTFESISFLNPSSSLTINALDGKDTVTVNSLHIGFNANLTINGGANFIASQIIDNSFIDANVFAGDTVTFAASLTLLGKNLKVDAERINVNAGVTISVQNPTGDSGNVEFTGENISLLNNSRILAAKTGTFKDGNVTLTADETQKRLGVEPFGFNKKNVSITLGTGSVVKGGNVTITSTAADRNLIDETPAYVRDTVIKPFAQLVPQLFNAIIPASVQYRAASATVTVTDATIEASGKVNITAETKVDSSVQAISTINSLNPISRVAIAYGHAESSAQALIQGTTSISGKKGVTVLSDVTTTNNVSARVFGNIGNAGTPTNINDAGFSIAVANSDTTSRAIVDSGVTITSTEGNIKVNAKGKIINSAKATTNVFVNGTAGVGIGLNFDRGEIVAEVNGTLTAAGAVNTGKDVDLAQVNGTNDTIQINDNGFTTGDLIRYVANGGTPIAGLTDKEFYYVIAQDTNNFRLSKATGLELDNDGVSATSQQGFSLRDSKEFDTQTQVDYGTNRIAIANHGFSTGQRVSYNSLLGDALQTRNGNVDEPLTNDLDYYIINIDNGLFQLANTQAEALVGTAIDLVATPTATTNSILFTKPPKTFNPAGANVKDSIVTLANHGFVTGDAVVYNVDGSVSTTQNMVVNNTFDPTAGINVNNDTIAIAEHGLKTGDKLTYLTTYLGTAGNAVGSLTSGLNYYAIVVDKDTIKLATSLADATAGSAINLTSTGTGELQNLRSVVQVTAGDTAIGGLADGETYFVSVIDANHFRLADSEVGASDAAPIDINPSLATQPTDPTKKQTFAKKVDEGNGIIISATLDAKDKVSVSGKTGGNPKIKDIIANGDVAQGAYKIFDFVDYKKNLGSVPGTDTKAVNSFSVGAGVGLNYVQHDGVTAKVGRTANLKSGADVAILATVTQETQLIVDSSTGKDEAGKSVSVSIGVAIYKNIVNASVESNASIDAKGAINVTSKLEYPFLFIPSKKFNFNSDDPDPAKRKKATDDSAGNVVALAKDILLDGKLGIPDRIMNTFVTSRNKGKVDPAKGGSQPTLGVAASIAINTYNNVSNATIKNGAKINQNAAYQTNDQSVNVNASTAMTLLNATGIISFDLNIDGIVKAVKKKDSSEAFSFSGNKAKTGFGGSVLVSVMNNSTNAKIEDDALIHTGDMGGLRVNAKTDIFTLMLAQSGGDAEKLGVSGSISFLNQTNRTIAQIGSGVKIDGGSVDVEAKDDTTQVTLVGAVQTAESTGVGVSIGAFNVSRDTQAFIGNEITDTSSAAGIKNTKITSVGDVKVKATNAGGVGTLTVAGAVVTNTLLNGVNSKQAEVTGILGALSAKAQPLTQNDTKQQSDNKALSQKLTSVTQKATEASEGAGLGIAGALSVNVVQTKTKAYINDNSTITISNGKLDLESTDSNIIVTIAGALAMVTKPKAKDATGIAGGFSANVVSSDTKSFVKGGAVVVADELKISATQKGFISSITGGVATANSNGGAGGNAYAGSISANIILSETEAFVSGSTFTLANGASITAQDLGQIWSVAGAVGYGGKGGIGISGAVNIIGTPDKPATAKAYIQDSTLTVGKGTVALSATSDAFLTGSPKIIAITGSVGIGGGANPDSVGVAGMIGVNIITGETSAYVKNSTIIDNKIDINPTVVNLTATDSSWIISIGGAVGVGQKTGVGAAIAYNEVRNKALTYIEGSTLAIDGTLTQAATSTAQITSVTVGVGVAAGASGNAAAGSLSVNVIKNTVDSHISSSSNVKTGGAITLKAKDTSTIVSIAGGTAATLGNGTAVGAAISYNLIQNTVTSYVDNSIIRDTGSMEMTATDSATLVAVSVGAAGSKDTAIGGSVTVNSIANNIDSHISGGSDVLVGGDLLMSATEKSNLYAISGGLALSTGGAAVGAAIAYNYVGGSFDAANPNAIDRNSTTKNKINAYIDNSKVNVGNNLSIVSGFQAPTNPLADKPNLTQTEKAFNPATSTNLSTDTIDFGSAHGFVTGQAIVYRNSGGTSIDGLAEGNVYYAVKVDDNRIKLATTSDYAFQIANGTAVPSDALVDLKSVGTGSSHKFVSQQVNVGIAVIALPLDFSSQITTVTVGGAGADKFALGGAVSLNFIRNTVDNRITNIGATQSVTAGGKLSLLSTDTSQSNSGTGGIGISLSSGAIGAAVSYNEISNQLISRIGSANGTTIDGNAGTISAAQFDLNSKSSAKIINVTFAGAGSAGSVAIGGAASVNNISNTIDAHIANSSNVLTTGVSNKKITIAASDTSDINATAFGGALALKGSEPSGTKISIGVAIAQNQIENDVKAYIDSSTISSPSGSDYDLDIESNANSKVNAQAIAIAVSIAAAQSGNVAISGAGAGAGNLISSKNNAFINSSDLTSRLGNVRLSSQNTSTINAVILAISGSVSIGGSSGKGAAIGAAVALNSIGYKENGDRTPSEVQTYIKNSSLNASGDLVINAVSNQSITANVGAGSVAISASSGTNFSGAGTGASTSNKIATLVKAYIDGDGASGIQAKSATITANDISTIEANVGAVSVAASIGSGGGTTASLTIGVALARNFIFNEIEASIQNADNFIKTKTNSITLSATTGGKIEAVSVAASISASVDPKSFAVSLSGAGAESTNTILSKTNVFISNSNITSANAVALGASNNSTISATVAAVAASVSVGAKKGAGISIGAAFANNYIGYDGDTRTPAEVQAYILNSSLTANGALTLNAIANGTINAGVGAGAVAVSASTGTPIAGAGAGAIAKNKIGTLIKAYIDSNQAIQAANAILKAEDASTIKADIAAVAVAAAIGDTAAFKFAMGRAISDNLISNELEAAIRNVNTTFKTTIGNIDLSASTKANITALSVAPALSLSITPSEINVSANSGTGNSTNTILTTRIARLLGSNVTSAGSISIAAKSEGTISATASSTSINTIQDKTNAYISNSLVNSVGAVALDAANTSTIDATVIAMGLDVDVVLKGNTPKVPPFSTASAIANNLIGYNDKGDRIPSEVQAYIENSSVLANGALTLNAIAAQKITATVGAVSVVAAASLASGGLPASVWSGSGVSTENKIATLIKAYIDGDGATGIKAKNLALKAEDNSQIKADAGAASVAAVVATSGVSALSVSIGVAIADNRIANEVEAAIKNAKNLTTTTGGIDISATTAGSIATLAVAASLSVSIDTKKAGFSASGGGAGSTNTVLSTTNARIIDSNVNSAGTVSLSATNTSQIEAKVAAVSVAVGVGSKAGIGVSIGAAIAKNYVGYDGSTRTPAEVKAYIQNSSINANGALTLSATNNALINASVGAGSAAVAGGGKAGVAASGSGVDAQNKIATLVKAYIDSDGATGIQAASASITASDTSTITADAGAASIAAALGGKAGVSLSIGVALANNLISNEVEAGIKNADTSFKTTSSDITINANSNATIQATAVAASFAAGGSGTAGVAISGAGAGAVNTILSKTNALISNSNVISASAVGISAANSSKIDATIVAVSVSVGVGGTAGVGVSIGAAVANNYIGYDGNTRTPAEVQAYIQNSSLTANGALTLSAINNGTINAKVGAGSAAVSGGGTAGVAASGSGVDAQNKIATLVKAYIDGDGATGIQAASASMTATDSATIEANAGAASIAAAIGGTAGVSLSIGVALANNLISNEVEAGIKNADNSFKTTSGGISIAATTTSTINTVAVAASLAVGAGGTAGVAISGAGAGAVNTILSKTNAYIIGSNVVSAGAVGIAAVSNSTINATVIAVSAAVGVGGTVGAGVSIGAAVANNYIGYNGNTRTPAEVQAYIQNSSLTANGALTLSAIANETINAGVGAGSAAISAGGTAGIAASGSGVDTQNRVATLVKAFIDGDGATGIQSTSATLTAIDTATIKADAGAASIAIALGGTVGAALSIGVALANNLISNEVEAGIKNADNSFKTTTGGISISATTASTINAVAVAASFAVGGAGVAGIAISGAGAGAVNTILSKTNAYIIGSNVVSAGAVSLNANNSGTINATIAAVAAAVGVGGTAGIGVAIGAAVASNYIGYDGATRQPAEVQAYIQNSSLAANGALTLSAVNNGTINAGVGAGAVAIAGGGVAGVAASGSGVDTKNRIATLVKAFIDGDGATGIQATTATLTATDSATIKADAGAASVAASIAGVAGVSVSIGVALADNLISNEVEAYIKNANDFAKTTTGGIGISATTSSTINAVAVAASVAVGAGGVAGVAVSGAGAGAVNTILSKTNAHISSSNVISAGAVSLNAKNSASIDATIVAVSAAIGGGAAAGVGISIGAAVANNVIGYNGNTKQPAEVQAYIENSSVNAAGALTLSAENSATIKAIVGAGSVAVAGGIGGFAGAGSGVNTENKIATKVSAYIDGDGVTGITVGSSSISAKDTSTIVANANSVAIAATIAIGGAVSVSGSIARNTISNNVQAFIQNADNGVTSTSGDIQLSAEEKATISAISVAASFSAGLVGLAGAGAESTNTISNIAKSYIGNSKVQSQGNLRLTAIDGSAIAALAGAISGGTTGAVGASLSTNNIANQINAQITKSTVTSNGSVDLKADSQATIDAIAVGASLAGLFAAGGAVTLNRITNRTTTSITDSSVVEAQNNVSLVASDESTIRALAGQVSVSFGASVGAAIATNDIANQVIAESNASSITSKAGDVSMSATTIGTIEAAAIGAAGAGGFAAGGSITLNKIGNTTKAGIANGGSTKALNNVLINAKNTETIKSLSGQVTISLVAAVGASVSINNITNTTEAYLAGQVVTTSGKVSAKAQDTSTISTKSVGGSGSLVALTGSVSVNNIGNNTSAYADTVKINSGSDVEILAVDNATIESLAGQFSVGFGAIGAAVAYNNISNTTAVYVTSDISNPSMIDAAGNILISADGAGKIDTIAAGLSAGLVGVAGSLAVNQMSNTVTASMKYAIATAQGSAGVLANSSNTISTNGGTVSGGLVGLGGTVVVNNLANITTAYLDSASLNGLANNSIDIRKTDGTDGQETFRGIAVMATSKDDLKTNISTAGIAGATFLASVAVNSLSNTTTAFIKDSSINSSFSSPNPLQNVYIKAFNNTLVDTKAGTAGLGIAAAAGASIDVTTLQNSTSAYITSGDLSNPLMSKSIVGAANDVVVEAKTLKNFKTEASAFGGGLLLSVQGAVAILNAGSGMSSQGSDAAKDTNSQVSSQLGSIGDMGKDSSGNSYIKSKSVNSSFSTNDPLIGTTAFITGDVVAGNELLLNAYESTKAVMNVGAASGGLIGAGGAVGIANVTHNASAYIGDRSTLGGGNITIQSTGFVDSTKVTSTAAAAGLVGLGAAVSYLTSRNNSKAAIGSDTVITNADTIKVLSISSTDGASEAWGASVGAAAVGVVISDISETGTTQAYVGDRVQVQNAKNLTVNAIANATINADSQSAAGGILSGNGTTPTATLNPTIQASIGDNNTINLTGDLTVQSDVAIDADANARGINVGGITVGVAIAEVTSRPTINTFVGTNTAIQANNVTIASNLGKAPVALTPLIFNPTNVSNSAETIQFSGNHGFNTGDQVLYDNGVTGTDFFSILTGSVGGLANNRQYSVIKVDDTTVKLGSQFDATTVNSQLNTLKFTQPHSFITNDKVIYQSNGGSTIGGLTSGNAYYVRVIDSSTIQLSSTAFTVDSNNLVIDTIEGAKVGDITNAGAGTTIKVADDINNLSDGNLVTYKKRTAIFSVNNEPLPDTGGKASIFNSSDSSKNLIAGNRINSASHGFENDDQVVYMVTSGSSNAIGGLVSTQTYYVVNKGDNDFQLSATKGGSAIDITSAASGVSAEIKAVGLKVATSKTFTSTASSTITLAGHGFTNGQAVTYTGPDAGVTTGNTYYVKSVTANTFELSSTSGGTAITLTAAASAQRLISTGAELAENTNYYVVGSTGNSFQLATTSGGSAITVSTLGLTGSGANHIFTKQSGVDFTSAGSGTQELDVDLTNTGNRFSRHTLTGSTSPGLPTVGDQVFSAYSQASSGSLIGVNATQSNLTIAANVNTYVGGSSSIIAKGNVAVTAQSNIALTGATTSNTFGAIAVGASSITANVSNNNSTSIGSNARIQADGNVTIDGESGHKLNISASGGAGSLITFAKARASADLNHNTITSIGNGASIVSLRDLKVRSGSNTTSNVSSKATAFGLYADADSNTRTSSAGNHQTNIGAAYLEGRNLTVESVVSNLDVTSNAYSQGAGLIGNIDARAEVNLSGTRAITSIGSGASLKADYLNLNAIYERVNSNATSNARCDGLGGDTDSDAINNMPLVATVVTDATSTVTVSNMNVEANVKNVIRTTNALQKKAWELRIWTPFGDIVITLDFGSTSTSTPGNPTPSIGFNSNVISLVRKENPLLVVDNGRKITQKSANVIVNGGSNVGDTINGDITVGNINNAGSGTIAFVTAGSLVDNGNYTSIDPAFDTVEIQNNSDRNLIINDIRTINTSGGTTRTHNGTVVTTPFNGSGLSINPTLITINNNGSSNLVLQGVIDNKHDRTVIFSNGSILAQGATQQIISRDLSINATAGNVGTSVQRVKAKLVRGYKPVTGAVPTSVSGETTNVALSVEAQGSTYFDVSTQALDTNPVTVNVAKMIGATGDVDLVIGSTTNTSGSAIASTYNFSNPNLNESLRASNNIKVDAGTSDTTIGAVTGNSGNGVFDFQTGNSISIKNTSGKINLQRAVSTQGSILFDTSRLSVVASGNVQAAQNVTFTLAGDFNLDSTASMTAGNNVLITNQGSTPNTTSINGSITATFVSILGNSSDDTINIQRILSPTYVYTGSGNDVVNVGSNQPSGGGTLSQIQNTLTLDADANYDILNIDDSGNTIGVTGTVTAYDISGFGMIGSINYANFENLNLQLGSGNDNVTVNNTQPGTTISGNGGDDVFTVYNVGGAITIDVGSGTDQLFTDLPLVPEGLTFLDPDGATPQPLNAAGDGLLTGLDLFTLSLLSGLDLFGTGSSSNLFGSGI